MIARCFRFPFPIKLMPIWCQRSNKCDCIDMPTCCGPSFPYLTASLFIWSDQIWSECRVERSDHLVPLNWDSSFHHYQNTAFVHAANYIWLFTDRDLIEKPCRDVNFLFLSDILLTYLYHVGSLFQLHCLILNALYSVVISGSRHDCKTLYYLRNSLLDVFYFPDS